MGGGGAKPSWVNVWRPGKPFPPTRTKYSGWQADIGGGLHEPLKAIIDETTELLFIFSASRKTAKMKRSQNQ